MAKTVDKSSYKVRLVDSLIEKDLRIFGAICIEGPKWCGKTWTSSYRKRKITGRHGKRPAFMPQYMCPQENRSFIF